MLKTPPASRFILFRNLALLGLLLGSQAAWSISVSPSPSSNGSYTVNWSTATGNFIVQQTWCDPYFGCVSQDVPFSISLQENNGSGWVEGGTSQGATSRSYSGKPAGTYQYRIFYSGIYGPLWSDPAAVAEGPVSVTVELAPSFAVNHVTVAEGGNL